MKPPPPIAQPSRAAPTNPAGADGFTAAKSPVQPSGPLALTLKNPPSQKELAGIFHITTRHLRRWERAESAGNRPCARPYTAADLWRLYRRRRNKGWDRAEAARLKIASLFERFDEMLLLNPPSPAPDEPSSLITVMLKSVAWEGIDGRFDTPPLPRSLGLDLVRAGKEQLRTILECARARDVLVRACFEAALLAEGHRTAASAESCAERSA